jgi:hypothetical protein
LKSGGGIVNAAVTINGEFSTTGNTTLGDQAADIVTINGLINDVKLHTNKDR